MTLEQLRIFVAVAERQHVTAAAASLGLTQSAASSAIASLESQYDIKLFDRIGRGIALTEKGVAFLKEARGVLQRAAEAEGLDLLFKNAGFEWRNAGCSMCLGMNPDILAPGERCASTSNRNFEGRQGRGGRTHLMSPAMAAAAAIAGHIVDVRNFL